MSTTGVARALADWSCALKPDDADLELARRALLDTLAVTLAARGDALVRLTADLPDAARWAAVGHVLDFDDLQVESTSHVSVVVVAATLAAGGDARAYLAGAGAMTRLGALLGWPHYAAGWHATCTQGAPAAAIAAGAALGLDAEQLAVAVALAIPAAGGVQAAFGTQSKALQVGFATEAGVRAARLAAAGATADPRAVDAWLALVDGTGHAATSGLDDAHRQVGQQDPPQLNPSRLDPVYLAPDAPAVPGGLAIKLHPCCYAMQRPIAAVRELIAAHGPLDPAQVVRITVTTPESGMQPLIHDRPTTGLAAKFSMPYALAAALLDGFPGFDSFTDAAVARPQARRLMEAVAVIRTPGGADLLSGEVSIALETADGSALTTSLAQPPGSPARPPAAADLAAKLAACGPDVPELLADITWSRAPALLRTALSDPRPATGKKEA